MIKTLIGTEEKPGLVLSFIRAQIVALIATGVDFSIMIFLKEVFKIDHLLATAMSALCGGCVGFLLGRYWAFVSTERKTHYQAFRYFLVMGASMGLNVGGMFLAVNLLGLQYMIGRIIVATTVAFGFNFVLHRHFVFK